MVPSTEALWRPWKRSCWVIDIWKQADGNTMQAADITSVAGMRLMVSFS